MTMRTTISMPDDMWLEIMEIHEATGASVSAIIRRAMNTKQCEAPAAPAELPPPVMPAMSPHVAKVLQTAEALGARTFLGRDGRYYVLHKGRYASLHPTRLRASARRRLVEIGIPV